MPPDHGLSNTQESGIKGKKAWLTYLFTENADGSLKLLPLIIGKAKGLVRSGNRQPWSTVFAIRTMPRHG
jgi:hypothetical protein